MEGKEQKRQSHFHPLQFTLKHAVLVSVRSLLDSGELAGQRSPLCSSVNRNQGWGRVIDEIDDRKKSICITCVGASP